MKNHFVEKRFHSLLLLFYGLYSFCAGHSCFFAFLIDAAQILLNFIKKILVNNFILC